MLDFDDLLKKEKIQPLIHPIKIFGSLNEVIKNRYTLRGDQQEILEKWYTIRKQADSLIKMNTGAGKTLLGLLIAQSSLNDKLGPVLYLSPNKYLADQVYVEANKFGLDVIRDESGPLSLEFLNSKKISITTFQRLFNGQSKFGLNKSGKELINIGTIIIDDAHSCINIAKESSSLRLERTTKGVDDLYKLFSDPLRKQSLKTLEDISSGRSDSLMMIPYWFWFDNFETIYTKLKRIIDNLSDDNSIKIFNWHLIRNELKFCNCYISGKHIEIIPEVIPCHGIPSLNNAQRRIFMTATLSDESILAREFGVKPEFINNVLIPNNPGEIGEKMIICPELVSHKITISDIALLCSNYSKKNYNVVVLTPSFERSKKWEDYEAIVINESLTEGIQVLKEKNDNFVIIVNRYDGIDLPDDCCRILVINDLPMGSSLDEKYQLGVRFNSLFTRANIAQKIEQGMGRAVRSRNDYAVVLITGADITYFIGRIDNLELFSPETSAQIKMSLGIAQNISEDNSLNEIEELINKCLTRDEGWQKYHQTKLMDSTHKQVNELYCNIAYAEHLSYYEYSVNNISSAIKILRETIASNEQQIDNYDNGWYLQKIAKYSYLQDKTYSLDIQKKAFEMNNQMLINDISIDYSKNNKASKEQSANVEKWFKEHVNANAAIVEIKSELSKIYFGSNYTICEEAFKNLFSLLGFSASRPDNEKDDGPDVLIDLLAGKFLILEIKSEVSTNRKFISKAEIGQLSVSMNWFRNKYNSTKAIPALFHPSSTLDSQAHAPENTVCLDMNSLTSFYKAIETFNTFLSDKNPSSCNATQIEKALIDNHLYGERILKYFVKVV